MEVVTWKAQGQTFALHIANSPVDTLKNARCRFPFPTSIHLWTRKYIHSFRLDRTICDLTFLQLALVVLQFQQFPHDNLFSNKGPEYFIAYWQKRTEQEQHTMIEDNTPPLLFGLETSMSCWPWVIPQHQQMLGFRFGLATLKSELHRTFCKNSPPSSCQTKNG